MFKKRFQHLLSPALALLLTTGLLIPKPANAALTYEFSGTIFDNVEASPFAIGEAFTGSLSIDLNAPNLSEIVTAGSYDAIMKFDVQFAGGLRLDGVSGGGISINTNFFGFHLVRFLPISQETYFFSESIQAVDGISLLFIDNTSSSLLSAELTDLPHNFDGFTGRSFTIEHLAVDAQFQFRSTGVIETFNVTAVPEPSSVLLCSVVALGVCVRRKWRHRSVSCA